MGDIVKKTVSIYIDQASAELAFDKLQQKADGFNKKIEDIRQRQQALNTELQKAQAAAAGLDALKSQYAELEKGISRTSRALDVTTASQKKLAAENKSLSATLEAATAKEKELFAQFEKATAAGQATKRLENNFEQLSNTIADATTKLRTNEAAQASLATRQQALATSLREQKAAAAALNTELKESSKAASAVGRLTAEEARLEKQLKANQVAFDKNAAAQKEIKDQIDAGLRPSFNQLENQVKQLHKELKNLSEDAPGYAQKLAAFQEASDQLQEMGNRISGVKEETTSLLDQFKGVAFAVAAGGAIESALEYIPSLISSTIQAGAALSDELADVAKATNLTDAAVEDLNKDLGKIDTRTGTSQLRQIAVGLGQVGEAVTKAKVAATDKIVVALGDEFEGGAKQITTELSVLRNNLQDIKTGDYATDVEHIGNALNVLGAEGLATAPVITDIANRTAGVAQQFDVTSGEILGFAATFQETGIEVERGSTALVKLFQNMAAEPAKFAKVAGLSVQEFTDLVNNDMNAAFIKVAKGIQDAGKENVQFSKILKDLDADGSGAGEVLSKLGQNSELLAAKQKLATQALKENTSITEEFTKKNSTLGAELEKLGKRLNSFFSNSALNSFLKGAVEVLGTMFEKTKDVNDVLDEQRDLYNKLQTDIVPVINRYDELQKKAADLGGVSKLSTTEQEELKRAIEAIAGAIPSAVTQFDAYGNAIGISTERARDFIRIQKLVLQDKNADAIQSQNEKIDDLTQQRVKLLAQLESANRQLRRAQDVAVYNDKNFGFVTTEQQGHLTSFTKWVNGLTTQLKVLDDSLTGAKGRLNELRGEPLLDETKPGKDPYSHEDTGGYITPAEAARRAALAKDRKFQTEEEVKAGKEARAKYLADLKQHNRELHDEELRREEEWQKQYDEANAFWKKWRALQEQQLKEYPEVQAKLDELLDTELNVQLRKLKEFYDKKRELYQNDARTLQQLQQAEDAEKAKVVADAVTRSVGQSTRDTLDRLKGAGTGASKETADRDYYADIQRRLLEASGRERLELLTRQVVAEKDMQLQNQQLTEGERLLIIAQAEKQISELKLQYEVARLQMVLDFAQQAGAALSSLADIATNKEEAQLKQDKRANDEKRRNYDRLLKSKAISQAEYNRRIDELNGEQEAKEDAIRKKQFERGKKLQLLQVAISTAQAVVSTLAAPPGAVDVLSLGAFRAIQIGIAVATGAAQAAAIASKKYARGGLLQGGSHAEGGIAMIDRTTGQEVGEAEGGEPVLSKKTYRNNPDLVNALLHASMYNDGARIPFQWQSRSYQGINYSGVGRALQVVKKYESGGVIPAGADGPAVGGAGAAAQQQSQEAMAGMMQQMMDAFLRKLEQPLQATVALGELNRKQATMNRIQDAATASR